MIIMSERFRGLRVLERYEAVSAFLDEGVEAIPMTPGELVELVAKPAWSQALSRGSAIVRDDYGLADTIGRLSGVKLVNVKELQILALAVKADLDA